MEELKREIGYLPTNFALRFSMNAAMPSFWSCDEKRIWMALVSNASPLDSGASIDASTDFFGMQQCERRQFGKLLRHGDRALLDVGIRRKLGHEAHVERFLRAEEIAGQYVAHRFVLADRARQALGAAAAGNDADLDFRLAEFRRLAGDNDVAGHRELTAAAEREPLTAAITGFGQA